VPVEQRLVEGADDALVPFANPHAPLTAVGVGEDEGSAAPEVPKSKALPLANTAKNNRNSFIKNRVIGGMISRRSQFYHSRLLREQRVGAEHRATTNRDAVLRQRPATDAADEARLDVAQSHIVRPLGHHLNGVEV
jgi:hypothetical protein